MINWRCELTVVTCSRYFFTVLQASVAFIKSEIKSVEEKNFKTLKMGEKVKVKVEVKVRSVSWSKSRTRSNAAQSQKHNGRLSQ